MGNNGQLFENSTFGVILERHLSNKHVINFRWCLSKNKWKMMRAQADYEWLFTDNFPVST